VDTQKIDERLAITKERFRCRLDSLGLDYRLHRSFYHPFVRIADFFIPHLKLRTAPSNSMADAMIQRRTDAATEWFSGSVASRFCLQAPAFYLQAPAFHRYAVGSAERMSPPLASRFIYI